MATHDKPDRGRRPGRLPAVVPAGVRWNWVVAAVCLGLIAWFRASDGGRLAATVFATLAVAAGLLALSPRPTGRRTSPQGAAAGPERPTRTDVERTLEAYGSRTRSWLIITIVGWGVAVTGIFIFPPLALVAAAASAFGTLRYRRYKKDCGTLSRALDRDNPRRPPP